MEIVFTDHAKANLIERKIPIKLIQEVILNPDKYFNSKKGRKINQKTFGNRDLRVIFKQTEKAYIVVTVYYTKIGRY